MNAAEEEEFKYALAKIAPCLVEGHLLIYEAIPVLLRNPDTLNYKEFSLNDLKHHLVVACGRCGQLFSTQILQAIQK